jgi:chaperonin GroES
VIIFRNRISKDSHNKRIEVYKMTLKPLADRVLVKNDKAETKTASGIIIPEAAQEKTQTATVVAVGPGTEDEKITVKIGDNIMYDKYAGTQVKIDGEEHLILRMSDIIAVIEK